MERIGIRGSKMTSAKHINNDASAFLNNLDPYRNALSIRDVLDSLGVAYDGRDKISCLDPNHEDTDPSMHIYDDHLYCFGCGKHLDVIGLVKEFNSCSFRESLEWIAKKAGLPSPQLNHESEKAYLERLNVNEKYEQILRDSLEHGSKAEEYLHTRGIPTQIIHGKVGYLPSNYFPSDVEACSKAGLISDSGRFLFSEYMIFPIRRNGKIEDFYGRFIGDTEPKYKHMRPSITSPPRPACFWNLDECRKKRFDEVYLTEGVIKGLALVAKDRQNVIAIIGNQGLSKSHIDLLKKSKVNKIIFAFDTDSNGSGQEAALTHARALFLEGFNVSIITIPKNDNDTKIDLDEYFISHTLADFDNLERRDYFSCLCDQIPKDGSLYDKKPFVEEALKVIANHGDELLIPGLIKRLKKSCGGDFTVEVLKHEFNKILEEDLDTLPIGKFFLPDPYANRILSQSRIIFYNGSFHRYEDGVYKEQFELEIKQDIQVLGNEMLKKFHIDDVFNSLKIKTFVRPDSVNKPGMLNLRNGILDIQSGNICPHSPDFLYTFQSGVSFSPTATCPRWEQFLNQVLPNKDEQLLLAEIFGYCLTPETSLHKGFLFHGQGSNGKSVVTAILEALLGEENCGALELNDFKSQFRVAELRNKLINISGEIAADGLVEDITIKRIISGDPITAEKKYQDASKITFFARLIASCNYLPKTRDKSHGWFRRWIILPFDVTISGNQIKPDLSKEIIKDELEGILNWSLLGLKHLRESRKFSIPASSNSALEVYKREINPSIVFIEENLRCHGKESAGDVSKADGTMLSSIYDDYKEWCENNGYKPQSSGNLASEIERYYEIKRYKKNRGKFLPYIFFI